MDLLSKQSPLSMISSSHRFLTTHNSDLRKTNKNLQIHSRSLNHSTVHGHLTKDSFSFFLSFLTVLVAKLCSTLFLCPWDSPGKNTGVGCRFFLQGIFPTQGSNLSLLHLQEDSYHWASREAPLLKQLISKTLSLQRMIHVFFPQTPNPMCILSWVLRADSLWVLLAFRTTGAHHGDIPSLKILPQPWWTVCPAASAISSIPSCRVYLLLLCCYYLYIGVLAFCCCCCIKLPPILGLKATVRIHLKVLQIKRPGTARLDWLS